MSAAPPELPDPDSAASSSAWPELDEVRTALSNKLVLPSNALDVCRSLAEQTRSRNALLDSILEALEQPGSRHAALALLHELRVTPSPIANLRVVRTHLVTSAIDQRVDVLLVPSIFEPEDWSYTFLEGLLRQPPEIYAGKTLAELGTGSGWISLVLLLCTNLARVYALDINPIAIKVARINAYLNSYDDDFELRDHTNDPPFTRMSVVHSDLLNAVIDEGLRLDLVVGCIPQVLSPDPGLDPERALSELTEEQLYDLSNYFVLQGVYEDQFGLGLLARALEQSVRVLRPGGKVMLNVAGRPGRPIIERMFTRRGYELRELWSRRVKQAADTDIGVLAELEQRTGQPFEFFVHGHSRQPIGAKTALAVQRVQAGIWHDVRVLEGQLRYEQDLGPFYEATRLLGYSKFWDQIDLSAISAEQVSFLRRLAQDFVHGRLAPYVDVRGSGSFRKLLARYLDQHFGLRVAADEIFLGPSQSWMLEAIVFSACEPGDQVLLANACPNALVESCQRQGVNVIGGNDDLSELTELTRMLKPRVVLAAPALATSALVGALRELAKACQEVGAWLVIDGSQLFDITSQVHNNPICEFLAERPPGEVLTLTGMVKNRVYPQLQPAVLLPCHKQLQGALVAFVESSYSRINCFTDRYYTALFEDIMSFQFERGGRAASLQPSAHRPTARLSTRAKDLQARPAFAIEKQQARATTSETLRLDYGENELPMPDRLTQGVLLGFTNLSSDTSPGRVEQLLAAWRQTELSEFSAPLSQVAGAVAEQFVLGAGVFPLIHDAARAVKQRLGRAPVVALAEGHYGYLPGVFEAAGCRVQHVAARAETGFALESERLAQVASNADILMVTNPNNPAGVFYDESILSGLVRYAAEHRCWMFSDEIFSALDLSASTSAAPRLEQLAEHAGCIDRVVRLDGLSKRLAAGGLRVGWAQCYDRDFAAELRALAGAHGVERHARIATEVLLRGFDTAASVPSARAELERYESDLRTELRARRERLSQFWTDLGAELPPGRPAGLFVFPNVSPLYGKQVRRGSGQAATLGEDNFADVLLSEFSVRVNPAAWASTRGHVRCCYSLPHERFELAMQRLEAFARALGN